MAEAMMEKLLKETHGLELKRPFLADDVRGSDEPLRF